MTYEHYLKQLQHMAEWRLTEKLSRNLELTREFDRNISHPLIRTSSLID